MFDIDHVLRLTCGECISFETHLTSARSQSNHFLNEFGTFYGCIHSDTTFINKFSVAGIRRSIVVIQLMRSTQDNCVHAVIIEKIANYSVFVLFRFAEKNKYDILNVSRTSGQMVLLGYNVISIVRIVKYHFRNP